VLTRADHAALHFSLSRAAFQFQEKSSPSRSLIVAPDATRFAKFGAFAANTAFDRINRREVVDDLPGEGRFRRFENRDELAHA
jgi:hypothetical protein